MREIKFRVWDKVSKKYRKFDGMHDTMMMINEDGKVEYYNLQNGSGGDEYILEQFTGLHDATKWEELTEQERKDWTSKGNLPSEWKGREIYEGDIVNVDNGEIIYTSKVYWSGGAFAIDCSNYEYDYTAIGWAEVESIEVIGNIHDNPAKDEIQP